MGCSRFQGSFDILVNMGTLFILFGSLAQEVDPIPGPFALAAIPSYALQNLVVSCQEIRLGLGAAMPLWNRLAVPPLLVTGMLVPSWQKG